MGYTIDATESGCYPGTTVLINKLDLKNQAALDDAERISVTLRTLEIQSAPISDPYTFAYYCSLHRRLFGDLYDWAGELRTINLSKKGTNFCKASNLIHTGNALFRRLHDLNEFRGLNREAFISEIAEFYHDLNMLHPFREGNGRTERLFFTLLIRRAGYNINFSECDTDLLMVSTVLAAQGVMDQLLAFFDEAIQDK